MKSIVWTLLLIAVLVGADRIENEFIGNLVYLGVAAVLVVEVVVYIVKGHG
jgi:hypothetical protein